MDKGKFADLNRAAQDVKTAIKSGKQCDFPEELLERLETGTAVVKDKTASKPERDLLSAYRHLETLYQDGLLLCRSRNHLSEFEFVPKGRIYVTQEIDPIIEKYDLPTDRHLYKPTGKYWRSISMESIAMIWERAEAEIKNIENMTRYN